MEREFWFQLLELLGRYELMEKRLEAAKNRTKETFEKEIGKLLGGKVTVKIEFNYEELKP